MSGSVPGDYDLLSDIRGEHQKALDELVIQIVGHRSAAMTISREAP